MEVTTEIEDGVAVVTLGGAVVIEHADRLGEVFGGLLADGRHNFVLDLKDVVVVDGAGLAQVVGLFKRVRIGPGDVRLCDVPPWVKVVLAMTRLNRVFASFDDRGAAVASFAGQERA